MLSANEIRQQFIDFFVQKHGHTFVPSSSVVPLDDDTLLFANAGMNQFKPIFLGLEKRGYTRAVNTQKCIRAGGKHNDLDDVGKDTYHHTFFEMLGNWSFGDYFKKEAIAWAWELLTQVWKLDPERLHVTVFEGDEKNNIPRDDEAAGYWEAVGVPKSRIHLGNKKDNFWEMGSTGPCGPCTEIHYDATPDKSGAKLVNQSSDQVVEIWNNVFIQFNRNEDQSLTPLPAQHVDTGMGFERITKVIQGKTSNYDTDIFTPILDAIGKLTGKKYGGKLDDVTDTGFRVIADHLRMATFAIVDGARPGNKKREAVLRSVIRRAVRYGYICFEQREPFLYSLVPILVEQMGAAFPELRERGTVAVEVLRVEEKDFFKTVAKGEYYLQEVLQSANKSVKGEPDAVTGTVSGWDAANLLTTYGYPIDMTRQVVNDHGMSIDEAEFEEAMEDHRKKSRKGQQTIVVSAIKGDLPKTDDSAKYAPGEAAAKVLGWVSDNTVVRIGALKVGDQVGLLLDRTNFYGEQGGQTGDSGVIESGEFTFEVEDTQRLGDAVLHLGAVTSGQVSVGDSVKALPGSARIDIMRNHTATHMMNLAMREVVGDHIEQKGSLVDADKLRFDFSHDKPLSPAEIAEIEAMVNRDIREDFPVSATIVPLAEAKKLPGVRAVFGEKYPDPVRVVAIGTSDLANADDGMSIEFCGGTHLSRTSQAGLFKIVSQENVSKGVRRVTAVTGRKAFDHVQEMAAVLSELTGKFSCSVEELPKRIDTLQEDVKKLQKSIQKGTSGDLNTVGDTLVAKAAEVNGVKLVIGEVPAVPVETLRTQMDRLRQKAGSAIIVLGWKNDDGAPGLMVGVSEDVIKKGVKSNDIMKPIAEIIGGKGGGPPHLATAGGKDAAKLAEALTKAGELAKGLLEKK